MKLSEPFATSIPNKLKLIPILFNLNINLPQISSFLRKIQSVS
jgi:hypothetical protein